jgi:SAM-dependent methyltransferase
MRSDHKLNRASWDELATLHGQDAYYDSVALVAGASSLIEEEEAALLESIGEDLTGRRILHLQCHLGFDAITFARRGAVVTGVDFSPVALAKAADLANRCGVHVDWICADATELPTSLARSFDLVWATIGVLCWIGDIPAWMRAVAGTLADHGRLVLIDGHPTSRGIKFDPIEIVGTGSVRRFIESGWDYATPSRTGPQVQYKHTLEDILSAAASTGLRVVQLREHTSISCDLRIDRLEMETDGRYRWRVDGRAVPVLFTLIGAKQHTSDG